MKSVLETVAHFIPDQQRDSSSDGRAYLGQPLERVDAQVKVGGEARFAAEFQIPGVAHAALVYSTIAEGTVSRIDTKRAKKAGGVVEIFTYKNMPRMKAPPLADLSDLGKGLAAS